MKVRKAIIPAAGLGTRFLPATKAQPKEIKACARECSQSHWQILQKVVFSNMYSFFNPFGSKRVSKTASQAACAIT